MAIHVNEKVDIFAGLNNQLSPASPEYKLGLAYRSLNARIDESGVWSRRQALVGCTSAPITQAGWGGGTHFKNLAVEDIDKIISGLGSDTSVDVGPNKLLYGTTGSGSVKYKDADGAGGDIGAPTGPTVTTAPVVDDEGTSRAESGIYYYIFTSYNSTTKHESVPTVAYMVDLDKGHATLKCVLMKLTKNANSDEIRIYRSKRTSAEEGVYNPTNIFYYIDTPTSATNFFDYIHDDEIEKYEYEGRGSDPPTDIDYIASYNNRMLYFKGNVLYWSSAGRPGEVAQEYTLGIATVIGLDPTTVPVECKPKLSTGVYGEAKYEIAELAGQKVTAAMLKDGKLWIWTASMVGYLQSTNRLEGYRFKVFRRGIGAISDKCLAFSPFGIFGADRQGMWLLNNADRLYRLTDGVIDIYAGEDTTLAQSDITDSFVVWIPVLNEAWWSVGNVQIAFQANRGIFVGPYTYSINGGCTFVSAGGAQAYLNGSTPSATTKDTIACSLDFWMGQDKLNAVKDQVAVEVVHSTTPAADVSAVLYQNSVPNISGLDSITKDYGTDTGVIRGKGSGRLFKLELTLPATGAPVAAINYKFNTIHWVEEQGRR